MINLEEVFFITAVIPAQADQRRNKSVKKLRF